MPFDAKVFSVMIASPSDVESERQIIRDVLSEWNAIHAEVRRTVLLPLGWETHSSPTMGERPQAIINKQVLKNADLLVGVFWTRLGTATGEYPSGTVEEIEEHIASEKPAMLYFSSVPVMLESVEADQYEALKKFKVSCKDRGLYETFSSPNEFREKFYRQLQIKLNHESAFQVPADFSLLDIQVPTESSEPGLSAEAQELLKAGSESPDGVIRQQEWDDNYSIRANGKEFVEQKSPRSRALWEGALTELEYHNLIVPNSHHRHEFRLTHKGFEFAGKLTAK